MKDLRKRKKPYKRPEGWERTIKRSYSDPERKYTGEKYEKEEEKELKKKLEKAKKGKFPGLLKLIFGD
jgi:hypothetical protein